MRYRDLENRKRWNKIYKSKPEVRKRQALSTQRWRERNPQKLIDYRGKNRDRILAYLRAYYKKNKKKKKEQYDLHYKLNKEKIMARQRKTRNKNKEEYLERERAGYFRRKYGKELGVPLYKLQKLTVKIEEMKNE